MDTGTYIALLIWIVGVPATIHFLWRIHVFTGNEEIWSMGRAIILGLCWVWTIPVIVTSIVLCYLITILFRLDIDSSETVVPIAFILSNCLFFACVIMLS